MGIQFEGPKEYLFDMPALNERGTPTKRIRTGLENVLTAYVKIAEIHSKKTDNNLNNYQISRIKVVGSVADRNRKDSDLDLLLITPQLDEESTKNMTVFLNMTFFTDKPKTEAIDPYIRREDAFPSRPSLDITDYVRKALEKYNKKLV